MANVIARIGRGVYRLERDGRSEIVYAAGPLHDRWVFWNGHVYRGDFRKIEADAPGGAGTHARLDKARPPSSLTAPMPARVIRILVQPGARVAKGDTLIVLEAMKMELPLRAPGDAVVVAVRCQESELVPADAVLMELGPP